MSPPPTVGPAFKTETAEAEFFAAYDAVLGQWPVPVESVDVPSAYGSTRVQICGPADGPPLVLLPGGGATSTVWFATVGELSRTHRVYAVDVIGDVGRSVHDGQRIDTLGHLMDWLDGLFAHFGIGRAGLCGHSYGGWLALSYALHAPQRVDKLVLLDPTGCFAPMSLSYFLHAVPLLALRTAERMRAFIRWETGGATIDPTWLTLTALGMAHFPRSKIVLPRRPKAEHLRDVTTPTLLLLAENSKSHNIARVAATAKRTVPRVVTTVLAGQSHHSVPTSEPAQLNRELREFLGAN